MTGVRKVVFGPGEIYHIYNRSAGSEQIFSKNSDINRFLELMFYYIHKQDIRYSFYNRLTAEQKQSYTENSLNKAPIIEVYAYALMPNHFHLLVKELEDDGITSFVSNIQNGFAKYYNVKNKRFGSVFQNPFKAKHLESDEETLHVSRYIHLNPVTSYLLTFDNLLKARITSFSSYFSDKNNFVETEFLTSLVGSNAKYAGFVKNQIGYQRKLDKIKHLTFD